jgi:hypothetical protein
MARRTSLEEADVRGALAVALHYGIVKEATGTEGYGHKEGRAYRAIKHDADHADPTAALELAECMGITVQPITPAQQAAARVFVTPPFDVRLAA